MIRGKWRSHRNCACVLLVLTSKVCSASRLYSIAPRDTDSHITDPDFQLRFSAAQPFPSRGSSPETDNSNDMHILSSWQLSLLDVPSSSKGSTNVFLVEP